MTVDAQLTIWIAHFIPPVQAMPTRNDRSSARAAGWLSVPVGVGDGWTTIVLIGWVSCPWYGSYAYLEGAERRLPVQRDERERSGGTQQIVRDPLAAPDGAGARGVPLRARVTQAQPATHRPVRCANQLPFD